METYQDLEEEAKLLQRYKDIFYRFRPGNPDAGRVDIWIITDNPNWATASVAYYNADVYRVDECINLFKEMLEENIKTK